MIARSTSSALLFLLLLDESVTLIIFFVVAVQYTWDKQLETWVKSSGILGGAGKVPTIISPKQYMKRFRIAMMVYFTLVPSNEPLQESLDPEAM